jgi:hypothetical protein
VRPIVHETHVTTTVGVGRAGIVSSRLFTSCTRRIIWRATSLFRFWSLAKSIRSERGAVGPDVAERARNAKRAGDVAHHAPHLNRRGRLRDDLNVHERVGWPFPGCLRLRATEGRDCHESDDEHAH